MFARIYFWAMITAIAITIVGIASRLVGWNWFFTPIREILK